MDADIVKRMREEEADLVRKLQAVREFLSVYGGGASATVAPARTGGARLDTVGRPKAEIDAFTAQTRLSVVLALQGLSTNPGLMKTSELVQFIESMGHTINGDNKVNALGALLSRSADVIGHGKSGWELADREKALQIVAHYAPKRNEASDVSPSEASESEEVGLEDLF